MLSQHRTTLFAYDAMSRKVSTSNLAIQSTPLEQLAYTPDGLVASLADANDNLTAYAYDGLDRKATTTYPDASTETLTYDADGNVLVERTRRNDNIAFAYDTLNRLTSQTPPAATGTPATSYSYDLDGRWTGVSSTAAAITTPVPPSGGTVQYAESMSYDALNRLAGTSWTPAATQTTPAASSVTFTHGYDATNRRVSQGVTNNGWWSYPTGAGTTSYSSKITVTCMDGPCVARMN